MKTLMASSRIGIRRALLEPQRLVERDGPVDVADPVTGMDELHGGPQRTLRAMIVERSMSDDFLSNTYLVAAAQVGRRSSSMPAGPSAR